MLKPVTPIKSKKSRTLPKGLKHAAPIKNPTLLRLLRGPDMTASGGMHTVTETGSPLRKKRLRN
jgi:hypothetical protein